jgi:DnaK suppressor protein
MTTPLTADRLDHLKAALRRRRAGLENQLAEHLHGRTRAERAHDVMQQDGDDAPQRAPEREVAAALTDLERHELDAVVAALRRIERGEYGQCADCGVDIPYERLQAEPWALRCVACETAREREALRRAGA